MFSNGGNPTVILEAKEIEGIKFGSGVRIEPYAVIYDGCEIGDNSLIGSHTVLRHRTKIGKYSIFGHHGVSEGDNFIGNSTTIHAQCHITKGITVGDDCFIAPFFVQANSVEITLGHHGTNPDQLEHKWKKGRIEDRVRIGLRVTVIPGVTIGHDSLIFQNCLITKDVEPFSVIKSGKDQIGRKI